MKTKTALPEKFWQDLIDQPQRHSFYNVMRWIDAYTQLRQPLGRNSHPAHEPIRFGQQPSMAFAPSTIDSVSPATAYRPAKISVLHYGLFGPNGPLPLHLTELARERLILHKDSTLTAFADIFHHRLLTLFYRAWADAQSTVSLDRPNPPFSRYISSLIHMGFQSLENRDDIMDHAKLFYAGHLLRQTRNPEGLMQVIRSFFKVDAQLEEYVLNWIKLPQDQQLQLGNTQQLGRDMVLGEGVLDAQHKFRLHLGPLSQAQFNDFLPNQRSAKQLLAWVRQYVGVEFAWDTKLVLDKHEVKGVRLGQQIPLGLASWMGKRDPKQGHAQDVVLDYEERARLHGAPDVPTASIAETALHPQAEII